MVPEELDGVDITSGCARHLQKLARLLLKCVDAFPFHTCPYLAFSEEGMASLGYSWDDVAAAVGLPPDYLDVSGVTAEQKFHYLRKEIEPLDRLVLERIAREELSGQEGPIEFHKSPDRGLVDYMAENLGDGAAAPRDVFLASVLQRISDVERES